MPRRAHADSSHLHQLARRGAEARVRELVDELNELFRVFPDLRSSVGTSAPAGVGRRRRGGRRAGAPAAGRAAKKGRGRRNWSTAQRQAARDRMNAYWAKRRRDEKSGKSGRSAKS